MSIKDKFTDHPSSVGETYTQHMGAAFSFGSRMIGTGFCCLLHGIFPFLFKTKGRETISTLHDEMVSHRADRQPGRDLAQRPRSPMSSF